MQDHWLAYVQGGAQRPACCSVAAQQSWNGLGYSRMVLTVHRTFAGACCLQHVVVGHHGLQALRTDLVADVVAHSLGKPMPGPREDWSYPRVSATHVWLRMIRACCWIGGLKCISKNSTLGQCQKLRAAHTNRVPAVVLPDIHKSQHAQPGVALAEAGSGMHLEPHMVSRVDYLRIGGTC